MNKIEKVVLITVMLIALMITIGGCVPAAENGETEQGVSTWYLIGFLVLIFGFFYFVMIRPQRKRQKDHEMMMQELQKGDKVMTAGGLYGTIESISEDSVVMKVESGASIRVARSSVVTRREQ